ncbi:MAG: phosphonate C-P lyase system protein PhnG [Desulfobacterales bacterium RIFOXYA12_FULL_46_15]|nr:MAG: phosphonate C-P lyase system protein PhnG [Desulfobacterales bacterium RIFOXYA12_FULL_46_15]
MNPVRGKQKMDRENWIGLLGSADLADLEAGFEELNGGCDYVCIIGPETGMLMVQAKTDGSGSRFNLGEMTVTKCVLELKGQYLGTGWVMGSDFRHAELAALFDGLLQDPDHHDRLMATLIQRLEEKERVKRDHLLKDVSDTKVEFFTLKRGE